jgi:hypothetical protein
MKRAEYTLSENFTYRIDIHDSIELPKYSHVVPMDARWVPKEIKEKLGRLSAGEVYVYTKFGIIIVPEKIMRIS